MAEINSIQARAIPRASRLEDSGAEGPKNGGKPALLQKLRSAQMAGREPVAGTREIRSTAPVRSAAKVEFRHPLAGSTLLDEAAWVETARTLHLSGRELDVARGVFDNCKETALAVC